MLSSRKGQFKTDELSFLFVFQGNPEMEKGNADVREESARRGAAAGRQRGSATSAGQTHPPVASIHKPS